MIPLLVFSPPMCFLVSFDALLGSVLHDVCICVTLHDCAGPSGTSSNTCHGFRGMMDPASTV